jgi:cytochrome P450
VGGPCSIDLRANEIGWFFQSFDACTALIGSALLALTRRLTVSSDRGSCEDDVDAAIAHVLTEAPPIHATRRYPTSVIDEGQVSIGCTDIVIVSLDPHDGPAHPFGSGPHLCPAGQLAPLIARHALVALPARLREPQRLRLTGWAPSLAARIPLFEVAS